MTTYESNLESLFTCLMKNELELKGERSIYEDAQTILPTHSMEDTAESSDNASIYEDALEAFPTESVEDTTVSTTPNEGNKNATIPQSPRVHKKQYITQNLGSIWAAAIIETTIVNANAYDELHKKYDHVIQKKYHKYVKAVLEVCTYLADQEDSGFKLAKGEYDWAVVKPKQRFSALGLSLEKFHEWSELDLSDNKKAIRHKDGRKISVPQTVSPGHPTYEFQEHIRKHMTCYWNSTLSQRERQMKSWRAPTVNVETLQFLDYRMALMNYANVLVDLVTPDDIALFRCQEQDVPTRVRESLSLNDKRFAVGAEVIKKVFGHVLKSLDEKGVLPPPFEKEQGVVFDKPRRYVAWCITFLAADMERADEMMDVMVKFAQQYFHTIEAFVNTDSTVLERKSKLLDAIKKPKELNGFQSTFGMVKTWFSQLPEKGFAYAGSIDRL